MKESQALLIVDVVDQERASDTQTYVTSLEVAPPQGRRVRFACFGLSLKS